MHKKACWDYLERSRHWWYDSAFWHSVPSIPENATIHRAREGVISGPRTYYLWFLSTITRGETACGCQWTFPFLASGGGEALVFLASWHYQDFCPLAWIVHRGRRVLNCSLIFKKVFKGGGEGGEIGDFVLPSNQNRNVSDSRVEVNFHHIPPRMKDWNRQEGSGSFMLQYRTTCHTVFEESISKYILNMLVQYIWV